MTEPHSPNEPDGSNTGPPADGPKPPATPLWVKVVGVVVGLLALAVLAKVLLGGDVGEHGPGMHGGLGNTPSTPSVAGAALSASPA